MGPAPGTGICRQVVKLWGSYSRPVAAPVQLFSHEAKPRSFSSTPLDRPYVLERRCSPDGASSHFKHPIAQSYITSRGFYTRDSSQLVSHESNKVIHVDTLALVRKLEAQGFTTSQAEAITSAMTTVLYECLESVSQSFVSKNDLQKSDMTQEAALSNLKADVQSSQESRIASVQRETENLRTDIDKLRTEMRYEMEKVSAGQLLDLNLERGRMRDELTKQSTETSNLTNKLDKEINALKTQLEASKFEVIKYCIGIIVSVVCLGLGLLRIFKFHP